MEAAVSLKFENLKWSVESSCEIVFSIHARSFSIRSCVNIRYVMNINYEFQSEIDQLLTGF